MKQSLSWLIVLVLTCTAATKNSQADDEKPQRVALNHGSAMLLRQNLVQSSEAARLLAVVDRQLELNNTSAAIEALQALFSATDADFAIEDARGVESSVYGQGIDRLRTASYQFRLSWFRKVEPIAQAALKRASEDSESLRLIAEQFPFTETGLRAELTSIRQLVSHGEFFIALAATKLVRQRYEGITVPFPANRLIDDVAGQLQRLVSREPWPARVAMQTTSTNTTGLLSTWIPKWSWSEQTWQDTQTAGVFAGLNQPTARMDLVDNSWNPAFDGNDMILRTPGRIVCVDLEQCAVKWFLPTDTRVNSLPQRLAEGDTIARRAGNINTVLRRNDLGNVTVSDGFLYFVDQFRLFEQSTGPQSYSEFRFNRNPKLEKPADTYGKRLVAVRLSKQPTVAWTVGDQTPFPYKVTDGDEPFEIDRNLTLPPGGSSPRRGEGPADSDRADTEPLSQPFTDHSFLGPPLAYEQSLFVLTSHDDSIWLNCLKRGTGRLAWRRPIAYANAARQEPRTRFSLRTTSIAASVVGVYEDTLLCLLNTGIVIGAGLADGHVRWATSLKSMDVNRPPLSPSSLYARSFRYQPTLPPVLHEHHLVWSNSGSDELFCLDVRSGNILWKQSLTVDGPGQLGQSRDLLPAGFFDDQLILTGHRHVRSLRLSDGSTTWVTPVQRPIGKAVLSNGKAWIPTVSGRVVPVDLATGKKLTSVPSNEAVAGSLYEVNEQIVATTPTSVKVYPGIQGDHGPGAHAPTEVYARALNDIVSGTKIETVELQERLRQLPNSQQFVLAELLLNGAGDGSNVGLLDQLELTDEQRFRRDLLKGEAELPDNPTSMVAVNEEHAVTAALALERAGLATNANSNQTAAEIARLPYALQQKTISQQGRTFDELAADLSEGKPVAAELTLLQSLEQASPPMETERLQQSLKRLRNSESLREQESQGSSPVIVPSELTFELEETIHLTSSHPMAKLLSSTTRRRPIDTTAVWPNKRVFLRDRSMFGVDLTTGAVSRETRLPSTLDMTNPITLQRSQPTLVPFAGVSSVGLVSLLNPMQPEVLWQRRWPRALYDNSPLRPALVSTTGVVFASHHLLTCFHPLTGQLLWSQEYAAESLHSVFGRQKQFTGNDEYLIVFGPDCQSGTVYRMADGQQIETFEYDVTPGIFPLIAGTRLLYPKDNRLKLIDLVTGDDLLQDQKIEILPSSPARLLDDERAIVLTVNRKISVVDLKNGQVQQSFDVPEELMQESFRGFRVFKTGSQLVISLRNGDRSRQRNSANSLVGDRPLSSGVVLVVDQASEKTWHIRVPTSAMMQVAGDESPFFVLWTRLSEFASVRQFMDPPDYKNSNVMMGLQVLDRTSGQELWKSNSLVWGNPLQCVHDADAQTITVETDASTIRLKYTE